MRSQLVLLALVGLTFASRHSSWKDNTEYVYQIRGRTLTGLNELADQYSGIFLKASLRIVPRNDGKLQGSISSARYAQIHTVMSGDWNSHVEDSRLSYKPLNISNKPFQIVIEDGLIKSLIVEKDISNWEANMIKSIVSQLQMDLNGKNVIPSEINILPTQESFEGVFKTMEETVTGRTETLYDIHRLPEYLLQSQPWLAPQQQLRGNGKFYEVVKSKNYSNSDDLPLYHYGFGDLSEGSPASNRMGEFFTRQSSSRMILSGQTSKFTIQSCQSVNKIVIKPDIQGNQQQGVAISTLNLTLTEVKTQTQQPEDLSSPVEIGNLVYTYDRSDDNKVQQKVQDEGNFDQESEENHENSWSRFRRSLKQSIQKMQGNGDSNESSEERQQSLRPTKLEKSPETPLLSFHVGYKGNSIKKHENVEEKVQKITREIATNFESPESITKEAALGKYSMLVTLIRLLNQEEIRSVTRQLYTTEPKGHQQVVWQVWCDAVSESGTGPALLNVEEWIQTKKIDGFKAASVFNSLATSVRSPSLEYMQRLFDLMKKVQEQPRLNSTALLAYSTLVHKVYVDQKYSANQYPVNSYGFFYTKEGKEFVKETVIPYFREELKNAVEEANSERIHAIIRSLGNVGHKKIMEVFEEYLEGQKQISQFQRAMIVMCMDKVSSRYPTSARAVLYRLYQNSGELSEIRALSAAQLLRTVPSAEMLQRMAQNTHTDADEDVNCIVKTGIEGASELSAPESQQLRKAAESAKPLLAKKQCNVLDSFNSLRNFVDENSKFELKQSAINVKSADHFLHKFGKYTLRQNMRGNKHYLFNFQAMVSSFKELFNTVNMQTESYKNNQRQSNNKWSSAKIAEALQIEGIEREQVEGFIYGEIEAFQQMWSFDNQTIEQFPQRAREIEEMLKNGKEFEYIKVKQLHQMTFAVPTEIGVPFVYTYEVPMLVKSSGKLVARCVPEISRNNKLHKPEQVTADIQTETTVSIKAHSQFSLITPFDHQMYVAGIARVFQIHLPVQAKIELNIQKSQLKIEASFHDKHQNANLLHYRTYPYTSQTNVMDFTPIALSSNTQRIQPKKTHTFEYNLGQKETGWNFQVSGSIPQKSWSFMELAELIKSGQTSEAISMLMNVASMEHTKLNIKCDAQQSTSKKVVFNIGYQQKYQSRPESQNRKDFYKFEEISSKAQEGREQRQQELLQHVNGGINNAWSKSFDASVEFAEGSKSYKHLFTLAFAKSNVNPESRMVAYYRCAPSDSEFSVEVRGSIKNTNGLDFTHSLNSEPQAKYELKWFHRIGQNPVSTIRAAVDMTRSQSRKNFLKQQPMYHVCKKEIQEGNHQLAACQNMTVEANYLNNIDVSMKYENVQDECLWTIERICDAARIGLYPMVESRRVESEGQNKVSWKIQFEPESLQQVNVTIRSRGEEIKFFNISLNPLAKALFVPHPVFHVKSRIFAQLLGQDNIRPTCVIDETAAQTFNNRTYPLSLGDDWTLLMEYIPQQARRTGERQISTVEQLENQNENFAVLVRESGQHKEVKITFEDAATEGKTSEVNLKYENSQVSTTVDGENVKYDDTSAAEFFNGFLEVYGLPNNEVKIEFKDWFYVIFDGERVKLTAVSTALYDSVYGLCGTFNDDQYDDFRTPKNCIVKSPETFVQSYKVGSKSQQPKECIRNEKPLYTNVISNNDNKYNSVSRHGAGQGTMLRNRYIEQNGDICFTIHPQPECKTQAKRTVTKNVDVHCVTKTKTAYFFKNQIDQGGNPDFSHKAVSKTVEFEVPVECY